MILLTPLTNSYRQAKITADELVNKPRRIVGGIQSYISHSLTQTSDKKIQVYCISFLYVSDIENSFIDQGGKIILIFEDDVLTDHSCCFLLLFVLHRIMHKL